MHIFVYVRLYEINEKLSMQVAFERWCRKKEEKKIERQSSLIKMEKFCTFREEGGGYGCLAAFLQKKNEESV